ncbi:AAA family ATPase [Mycolicibacterium arabiense]|nr:AAA family ATPase [Mycolicibacterium arabiense]
MIGDVPGGTVIRTEDSHAVDALLAAASVGPCALVIGGEPGIGKTTLWAEAVELARAKGHRVLTARSGEAESVLAYAAVADLLADVEDRVLDQLPELQRLAVDRVLLRADGDGPPTDQRVTAAALVSIVWTLAASSPVLVAIDDAQWLDSSSQSVLDLAMRKMTWRVGVVLTERTPSDDAVAAPWLTMSVPGAVRRIRVRPMSPAALQTMIQARFGRAPSRSTLLRISEASRGNPFFALELARAVDGQSIGGEPVLPGTLADLMQLRTGHFGEAVRDMLLAAACVADPTVGLLAEATGSTTQRVLELLDQPGREGIVVVDDDRVRFTHPLLARGIYTQAGPARRRRMHRALAAVESQPELRARHMALGAASADSETLRALDTAADSASARGAVAAAAELMELAITLGGDTFTRRLRAATYALQSGDAHRSRALLKPVAAAMPSGAQRASARLVLADTWLYDNSFVEAVDLLTSAEADAAAAPELLVQTYLRSTLVHTMTGRFAEGLRYADLAVAEAERLAVPALLSQALTARVSVATGVGLGRDEAALQRALELEDPEADVPVAFRARAADAVTLAWLGRLEEARTKLLAMRRQCIDRGSDADLVHVSRHLVMADVWLARYGAAEVVADDMVRRAEQLGSDHAIAQGRAQRAMVWAYQGREGPARNESDAAIEAAKRCGVPSLARGPRFTLGFLEVSRGAYDEALVVLEPLLAAFTPGQGTEIVSSWHLPDAVEAMVNLGRLEDAEPLVVALERNGAELDRPWMLAVGARCRAMLQAARGDLEAAEASVARAMTAHDRLPMPFERARTTLFAGQLARRRRRKQVASQTLTSAMRAFGAIGTPLWEERARTELARVTVTRGRASSLTPSEASVARLAAAGRSNRDIAAALFITPKTVEHNLTRVYRKLGIRARAELARHADAFGDD